MKLDLAYILQADTPDGLIKIGRSGAPAVRIAQIAQAVPFQIRLICILAHGLQTEREMKEALRPAKVKGEWYEPDERLIKFLERAHQGGLVIERAEVTEDYYNEALFPKLNGYVRGRRPNLNDIGDLIYRMLHGEPLAFIGREHLLFKGCGNTFTITELLGYRPARAFGPVVLNGKRIEMLSPERAEAIRQGVG